MNLDRLLAVAVRHAAWMASFYCVIQSQLRDIPGIGMEIVFDRILRHNGRDGRFTGVNISVYPYLSMKAFNVLKDAMDAMSPSYPRDITLSEMEYFISGPCVTTIGNTTFTLSIGFVLPNYQEVGLPDDSHVEVFMDLARQNDEKGFKDLARMILDGLTAEDINDMWVGTRRRLGRREKA